MQIYLDSDDKREREKKKLFAVIKHNRQYRKIRLAASEASAHQTLAATINTMLLL